MSTADRKAVVKHADMGEEMQQDAIDCANVALEKFNIEKRYRCLYQKRVRQEIQPYLALCSWQKLRIVCHP